jgi:hypothetical protein
VKGLSSGTAILPSSGFTITAPSVSAIRSSSAPAPMAPRPAKMTVFLPSLSSFAAAVSVLSSGKPLKSV